MTTSSPEQLIRELRDDIRIFADKCTAERNRLQLDIEKTKSDIVDIRRRTKAARIAKQVAAKKDALNGSELAKYEELHQNISSTIKKTRLALANTNAAIGKEQEKSNALNNKQNEVDIMVNVTAMLSLLQQSDSLLKEAEHDSVHASTTDLEAKARQQQQSVTDTEKEMIELKKEWDESGYKGWRTAERTELLKIIYEETKLLNRKYILLRLELNTANRAICS